jgi:hypothetical protein
MIKVECRRKKGRFYEPPPKRREDTHFAVAQEFRKTHTIAKITFLNHKTTQNMKLGGCRFESCRSRYRKRNIASYLLVFREEQPLIPERMHRSEDDQILIIVCNLHLSREERTSNPSFRDLAELKEERKGLDNMPCFLLSLHRNTDGNMPIAGMNFMYSGVHCLSKRSLMRAFLSCFG